MEYYIVLEIAREQEQKEEEHSRQLYRYKRASTSSVFWEFDTFRGTCRLCIESKVTST